MSLLFRFNSNQWTKMSESPTSSISAHQNSVSNLAKNSSAAKAPCFRLAMPVRAVAQSFGSSNAHFNSSTNSAQVPALPLPRISSAFIFTHSAANPSPVILLKANRTFARSVAYCSWLGLPYTVGEVIGGTCRSSFSAHQRGQQISPASGLGLQAGRLGKPSQTLVVVIDAVNKIPGLGHSGLLRSLNSPVLSGCSSSTYVPIELLFYETIANVEPKWCPRWSLHNS